MADSFIHSLSFCRIFFSQLVVKIPFCHLKFLQMFIIHFISSSSFFSLVKPQTDSSFGLYARISICVCLLRVFRLNFRV